MKPRSPSNTPAIIRLIISISDTAANQSAKSFGPPGRHLAMMKIMTTMITTHHENKFFVELMMRDKKKRKIKKKKNSMNKENDEIH